MVKYSNTPLFLESGEYSDYRVWGVLFIPENENPEFIRGLMALAEQERREEIWKVEYEYEDFSNDNLKEGVENCLANRLDQNCWISLEAWKEARRIYDKLDEIESIKSRFFRKMKEEKISFKYYKYDEVIDVYGWE